MTSMTHKASALDFLARSTVNVDDEACHPVAPDASFTVDVRYQEDGTRQIVLFVLDDFGRMQHRIRLNEGSVRELVKLLDGALRDK
ncbi:hypothetical protein L2W58_06435 [Dethiosulfovibrio sp. F2B]|uniref:hypothetical protein n=1 Tax=Dethiosulfovibrio faecalis TaxID=2720018 RepID=UPI001F42474D|nr:hypothetical protein [Dethiosulfovibrio faecalis]MCF4151437.1 hypothetical protein [Dethiosulfovibrio faecalis]